MSKQIKEVAVSRETMPETGSAPKKMAKKMGLGRGLGSLLGDDSEIGAQGSISSPNASHGFVKEEGFRAVELSRAKEQLRGEASKKAAEDRHSGVSRPESTPKTSAGVAEFEREEAVQEKKPMTLEAAESGAQKQVVPEGQRIWNFPVERLAPNPSQPRKDFSKDELASLAASIKEKGILQPISCRKHEGKFEIIAGERRWRAAQMAGLQEVPVIIKDLSEQDALEFALIENIQRENLNPVEEAEAYFYLIKKYKITQQELSERVGKDRTTIANALRILNLSVSIRNMLRNGELSMGQAKALASVGDPQIQNLIAQKAKALNLSVRSVEKMVSKYKEGQEVSTIKETGDSDPLREEEKQAKLLAERLQRILGTKVSIDCKNGKGKISIRFYSRDELNNVYSKIDRA